MSAKSSAPRPPSAAGVKTAPSASATRAAALRQMLELRHEALAARIREGVRAVREAAPGRRHLPDAGDTVVAESSGEMEMALMQVASETLRQLDSALQRLAQGRYGDCAECGGPIAQARLDALPFAIRCIDCEADREQAVLQRRADSSSRWSLGY